MSAAVSVASDGVRLPIPRARVASAARAVLSAEGVRNAMLSVTFLGDDAMRALNRKHLKRNRSTDVIAFGFRRRARRDPIVGDVYIAPSVARASAAANGIGVQEEVVRLVVHGVLHVLGYDHPESSARMRSAMWRRQERLVSRLMRAS